jgi:hypothetical protein
MLDLLKNVVKKYNPDEVQRGRVLSLNVDSNGDTYSVECEIEGRRKVIPYENNSIKAGDLVVVANPLGKVNGEVLVSWSPLKVEKENYQVQLNAG